MVRKGVTSGVSKQAKNQKKVTYKWFIDTTTPITDGILDLEHFEKYISSKMKVQGSQPGDLRGRVRLFKKENMLHVHADVPFSKRYLKYLTKKYLKKQELKEFLRVVSVGNKANKRAYKLTYWSTAQDKKEEGAEAAGTETAAQ